MIRKFLKSCEFRTKSKPAIQETSVGSCVDVCLSKITNCWASVIKTVAWGSDAGGRSENKKKRHVI